MIKLNGIVVPEGHFPDGSLKIDFQSEIKLPYYLTWLYENDAELFTVICIRKHFAKESMVLEMPYCPHARMDRVENQKSIFTLKYFADEINNLNFSEVRILDPHSNVCVALINNVKVEKADGIVNTIIQEPTNEELVLFYPDEGAMKRYAGCFKREYAFGIKQRDWITGKIKSFDLVNKDAVKGKDVLIIDDICSRGQTFYYSAKALKEAGAKRIYLFVTHCENTILDSELLSSGLIEYVYTTNSIFTRKHERVKVFNLW